MTGPNCVGGNDQGATIVRNIAFGRLGRHSDPTILVESDRDINPDRKLARAISIFIHRTHWIPTKKGTIATRRLLPGPNAERTWMSNDGGVARQRPFVGDALDNEQWSDSLFNPSSH